jgi:hypothetical protein
MGIIMIFKKLRENYGYFLVKKDNDSKVYNKKGDNSSGSISSITTVKKNVVTIYGKNNEIMFQGMNYVDCYFKRFSLLVFFDLFISGIVYYIFKKRLALRSKELGEPCPEFP